MDFKVTHVFSVFEVSTDSRACHYLGQRLVMNLGSRPRLKHRYGLVQLIRYLTEPIICLYGMSLISNSSFILF